MQHLDLSYIKENVSDDPSFIIQILDVFLVSLETDLPPLKTAIDNADYDGIRSTAHKVKSGFRSLGMQRMTQFLQGLEDNGKDKGSMDQIRLNFDTFLQMIPEVKSEVEAYRTANG
ncbi:MAG: Hpt domain-containing protein [Cryomorphaceae bacterium]